jgi:hypothetical protein
MCYVKEQGNGDRLETCFEYLRYSFHKCHHTYHSANAINLIVQMVKNKTEKIRDYMVQKHKEYPD